MIKAIIWLTRRVNEPFEWNLKPWQALIAVVLYLIGFGLALWGLHETGTPAV